MTRIIFVDDDEAEQLILRRALRPFEDKWDMTFVSRGQDVLNLLEQKSFDVIVSDMQMPEMNGLELLETVMRQYPDMVRIILSGIVEEETKLRSVESAQVWMAKPCDTEFLKSIVERTCSWSKFLKDASLKRLIGQMRSLPSVPHLYMQLVEELRSPETSFRKVAEIVASDVGMTAKLLQIVNSAFFGFYNNISSLEQAVSILGLNMIKALVLSVRIFSQFDGHGHRGFSVDALMNHSTATGALARMVAKTETRDRTFVDEAFMAGMLHDTGKLVLAHNLPAEYAEAMALAREKGFPLWCGEREVFGASHADIGAYLLALWGMPDAIVEATAYHHTPSSCQNPAFSALTAVHVANVLEHRTRDASGAFKTQKIDQEYLETLGMEDRVSKWTEMCQMLARRDSA